MIIAVGDIYVPKGRLVIIIVEGSVGLRVVSGLGLFFVRSQSEF